MSDIWSYEVRTGGGICRLSLSGEIDMAAEDELLRVLLAEVTRSGTDAVHVDLDEVTFLDSAGTNTLVRGYNAAMAAGRGFHLVRVHRPVLRVLEISGLMPLLAVREGGEPATS